MAWSSPRTWIHNEVVTASVMNTHLRDNLAHLKTPFDDSGRVVALDAAHCANLDGTNLTAVAKPAGGNIFTAGVHQFSGTSRIRIPAGLNKYDGAPLAKTPGSLWTSGDYLHHVASNGNEWRYLGTLISTPAGALPSIWVEAGFLYYISENLQKRRVDTNSPQHTDSAARGGSLWVETYVHHIQETGTQEYADHNDVVHSDHADHADHSDHVDHTDHTDSGTPHSDHNDHSDHIDLNLNPDHWDHQDHSDHTDHNDSQTHDDLNPHNDHQDHSDIAADSRPESVGL